MRAFVSANWPAASALRDTLDGIWEHPLPPPRAHPSPRYRRSQPTSTLDVAARRWRMKQWELYGITDSQEAWAGPAEQRADNGLPMVLWTTDHLLEFTSSPATGLLHLGLGFDPLARGLLDVFGPQESGVNV